MEEGSFNKEEILSIEDLIEGARLKIDKAFSEMRSRAEVTEGFLEVFCSYHMDDWVWFVMWRGGGSYVVADLLRFVDCSRSNLYEIIEKLLMRKIVKMVGDRYQAVSPSWFVRRNRNRKDEPERGVGKTGQNHVKMA